MIRSPTGHPFLTDEQIERFARQIIVQGVGAEGQLRLCTAEVFVDGHLEGRRTAERYLRAAGARVATATAPPPNLSCVVLAGTNDLVPERMTTLLNAAPLIAWYALVGRTIRAGLASAEMTIPDVPARDGARSRHAVLAHRIAGADVATTAVAALLGWITPGDSYELELP